MRTVDTKAKQLFGLFFVGSIISTTLTILKTWKSAKCIVFFTESCDKIYNSISYVSICRSKMRNTIEY